MFAINGVIDTVAGTPVDFQFPNSTANGTAVAEITILKPYEPSGYSSTGLLISDLIERAAERVTPVTGTVVLQLIHAPL